MRIETQAARNTDPETSHMAIDGVTKSGKRLKDAEKVLLGMRLIQIVGTYPPTGGEVAEKLQDMYSDEIWTREKALKRLGDLKGIKVQHGSRRACTALEHRPMCVTWVLK